jgi:acetate kinase
MCRYNAVRIWGNAMLLVVNAGSSSIKVALFDDALVQRLSGSVTEIGSTGQMKLGSVTQACAAADHRAALELLLQAVAAQGFALETLRAAAHRVVHGGATLLAPCRLTGVELTEIKACVPLAPLHNPANLTGIEALADVLPDLPQYASFDTAFHATNAEVAVRYAIPLAEHARGIRRYGFHGISYAGLAKSLQTAAGTGATGRVLALHLGNGASLCAMVDGQSVATTMGYSPLDGLTMGTRAGGIDGNAVLRLAELHGIAGAGQILNNQSGLLALGGTNDLRALQAAATPEADFARAHFTYWVLRHAGSMIAAMKGLDVIAFTGGIGENDVEMRAQITDGLAWAGQASVHVVAAEEERTIAGDALALIRRGL